MTHILEFLACELGTVTLEIVPTGHGFSVQLQARGADVEYTSPSLEDAVDTVASKAVADYRAKHAATLQQAESQAASARETIAAIDELMTEAN
jgi:hypothetical protein